MFNRKKLVLSSAISMALCQAVWAADPVTNIQVSGQAFSISLQPGDYLNAQADWWILANQNGTWYHYQMNTGWEAGLYTTLQAPLEEIDDVVFNELQGLNSGSYTLYFGVDTLGNGQMDIDQLYYSSAAMYVVNSDTSAANENNTAGFSVVSGTESTSGVYCDYSQSVFNDSPSVSMTSTATWSCSQTTRDLVANGIPDHMTGTFPNPGNPNYISEQYVSISYPLMPVQTDTATVMGGPSGATGYVLNGVKIDAATAGTCDDSGTSCSLVGNSGNWNIEALGQSSFDFGDDENHAHVQPDGSYHYHGIPEGFVTLQGGHSSTMTLIGWAADGFPIYARYGYSVATDASSPLKTISGSYQLVSSASNGRPSTDIYPLGTFSQDWEYVDGSGDLDECNGRFGVTPEFPNGIYHYYATDSYPYLQRCVKGEVDVQGGGVPSNDSGQGGFTPSGVSGQNNSGTGTIGGGRPPMGPPR